MTDRHGTILRAAIELVRRVLATRAVGDRRMLAFALAIILATVGCGGQPEVPVGDAADNIRKLALAYVQFAAANRGVGPANQESLTKFMVERSGIPREEADKHFVSIRDNQPYVIRWGLRPMGSGAMGPEVPKPETIIFERTGADGIRYVADGRMSIRQLTDEQLGQLVPDFQNSSHQ